MAFTRSDGEVYISLAIAIILVVGIAKLAGVF